MKHPQAPEIFQKPLDTIDLTGLPPRDSRDFEQAVIMRIALDYASKGWTAAVTVSDGVSGGLAGSDRKSAFVKC